MPKPFDPTFVPTITRQFLKTKLAEAPPGQLLHALYLGRRQVSEMLDCIKRSPDDPPQPETHLYPIQVMGIKVYLVDVESHFLATFLPVKKEDALRELLDYCDTLDTCQDCPPQFMDLTVMAHRVRQAYWMEVAS